MASEANEQKTISKNNTGFPAYMDFDKLRSEGIEYLGKLSGKIWTDHNVHDPGITIFEVLCYALIDLGYRTNLPVEDLLARNPAEPGKDDNFFTPAQILTCNPLTITDYRKLLIDIPGVKNAWLEPATDIKDPCDRIPENQFTEGDLVNEVIVTGTRNNTECTSFLNGLYHVIIEAEDDIDTTAEKEKLTERVKEVLLAHRNLCEDFADIFILCRINTGVCANVELNDDADAETVYLAIAEQLRSFFSPAPKFYTLPQLLEEGMPIDEIFTGRPYSAESHGFVKTAELDTIKLRKEIHLSDVYHVLLEVPGVQKVSRLRIQFCDKDNAQGNTQQWKTALPENHVPSFSIACSGIEFTRRGMPVTIDKEKFETLFELNFAHTGKVLHKMPSPYLDGEIPRGNYHSELENYYSIQNDFPHVYGIEEGGLSATASDKRRALALQLKGYLLFFDQLLANYLSQLSHIRHLFAFSGSSKRQHSYFLNTLTTVPEMEKLLRFGSGSGENTIGESGSILVYPVQKQAWEQLVKDDKIKTFTAENLFLLTEIQPYTFGNLNTLGEQTALLQNDMMNTGNTTATAYITFDDCWVFAITTSSDDFVLLGKKLSATQNEALQQAASVQYCAVFEKNYRSFLTGANRFTFNIELNIVSYTEYLGLLVEDETLFIKRRKGFLAHLLSRFSEKFTDFALMNWKAGSELEGITGVEQFLVQYDELGRNRGRGYNYLTGGWAPDNISGFEKKVKALAGMPVSEKNNLCHFVVAPYDGQYTINLHKLGIAAFEIKERFDVQEDAQRTAHDVITAIGKAEQYQVQHIPGKKEFRLLLNYGGGRTAVYPKLFSNSNEAEHLRNFLVRSYNGTPAPNNITEHSWKWQAYLKNEQGKTIRTAAQAWHTEAEAIAGAEQLATRINDIKKWEGGKKAATGAELFPLPGNSQTFIDIAAFNIDITDTIIGKPGKFTYDVLDKATNSFKLCPVTEFSTAKEAWAHCCKILSYALNEQHYQIVNNKETGRFRIMLHTGGEAGAYSATEFATKQEALKTVKLISGKIAEYRYTLEQDKTPETWKFSYLLGHDETTGQWLHSEQAYPAPELAREASEQFHQNLQQVSVKVSKAAATITAAKLKTSVVVAASAENETTIKELREQLALQQHINKLASIRNYTEMQQYVQVEGPGELNTWVYRLVNKNRVPAWFTAPMEQVKDINEARKAIAAASKNAVRDLPEICLGGDIFRELATPQNGKVYRYQVKLHGIEEVPGGELVLFESIAVYHSKEEAQEAFENEYLHVLRYAMNVEQYGKKIHLWQAQIPNEEDCGNSEAIVFIPAVTLRFLETQLGTNWKEKLAEYVNRYPVKIINSNTPEFALLFCLDLPEPEDPCTVKEKWVYYFSMPVGVKRKVETDKKVPEWRSTHWYETPDTALNEFRYFAGLLKYTGNYYTDCACEAEVVDDPSQLFPQKKQIRKNYVQRVFIREVLAESANWYEEEKDAWGPLGIEQFICAVQSPSAFNHVQNKSNGCYSYYITCGSGLLEHPCKYDTEKQRDEALEQLYREWENMVTKGAFNFIEAADKSILYATDGKPIARLMAQQIPGTINDFCFQYTEVAETIKKRTYRVDINKGDATGAVRLQLSGKKNELLLVSIDSKPIENPEEIKKWIAGWEHALHQWACWLPITSAELPANSQRITKDNVTARYKYCIEIKLPGFNTCAEDVQKQLPCSGCDETASPLTEPICTVAWKSACCYYTCAELMGALKEIVRLLSVQKYYQPVFDCDCNSFGIQLHINEQALVRKDTERIFTGNEVYGSPVYANRSPGNIIARNPQCYTTPNEVCISVETAKKLVNSEGVHIAEHILLRPQTQADCDCIDRQPCYDNGCQFPSWPSENNDPCNPDTQDICFQPGTDPYSFMATVVLPAWSQRFRDKNNRAILEQLMYQEAPAHVLLRIIWLRPADFCLFECELKKWRQWLTGKNSCNTVFNPCNMINLLFKQYYNCLDDCIVCSPCTEPGGETTKPCSDNTTEKQYKKIAYYSKETGQYREVEYEEKHSFLNQVNEVYCLVGYCLPRPEADECQVPVQKEKVNEVTENVIRPQQPAVEKKQAAVTIAVEPKAETEKKPVKKEEPVRETKPATPAKTVEPPPPATTKHETVNIQLKAKVINARIRRYKNAAVRVMENTKGSPLAEKALRFMEAAAPTAEALDLLVAEIIRNEKPAGKKGKNLNKKQQEELAEAALCFYLDKNCFNGKEEAKIKALIPAATRMKKAGMDVQSVYNFWDAAEVEKYEPETDTDFIRHIITGARNKK